MTNEEYEPNRSGQTIKPNNGYLTKIPVAPPHDNKTDHIGDTTEMVVDKSNQSNTLGTTMEARNKISEILVKWSIPTRQVAINEILDLIAQSKTDLLNALIEREEEKIKWRDTQLETEKDTEEISYLIGGKNAIRDTINHLKSLRDSI